MQYSMNIQNWHAIAPGLNTKPQWQEWANGTLDEWTGEIAKYQKIPMMTARRMSVPSRLAVETGLTLLDAKPDAAIFISRHGELERTYKIVRNLAENQDLSPTDFAMSVHNTAAGLLTIVAKQMLPITSLAAGRDGFQQGLMEAQAMLVSGATRILLVDFDGIVPAAYHASFKEPAWPYAVGLLVSAGDQLHCQNIVNQPPAILQPSEQLPQVLQFLRAWLSGRTEFVINGSTINNTTVRWQWNQ